MFFVKGFEDIVKSSIELHRRYFERGSELLGQLSQTQNGEANDAGLGNYVGPMTELARLNIEHYQNVMKLSLEATKSAFGMASDTSGDNSATDTGKAEPGGTENDFPDGYIDEPAFVLSGTGHNGGKVILQFVLDNIKEEEVLCRLVNHAFVNDKDTAERYQLASIFEPQSFTLQSREAQKVAIVIEIPADMSPGVYNSRVQVIGFEPVYFLIQLQVVSKPKQTSPEQ